MNNLEIIDKAIEDVKNDGNLSGLVRVQTESGHFVCTKDHPIVLANTLNLGGKRDGVVVDKATEI